MWQLKTCRVRCLGIGGEMNIEDRNVLLFKYKPMINKYVNLISRGSWSGQREDVEQLAYEIALKCIGDYYDKNVSGCCLSTYLLNGLKARLPRAIYRMFKAVRPPVSVTDYYSRYRNVYNLYGQGACDNILKSYNLTKDGYNYYIASAEGGLCKLYVSGKDNRIDEKDNTDNIDVKNDLIRLITRYRNIIGRPSMEAIIIKYFSKKDCVLSNIEVGNIIGVTSKAVSERIRTGYKKLNKIISSSRKYDSLRDYIYS